MYAINAYTGNWVQTETVALYESESAARADLMSGCFARDRPGMTLVIERVNVKPPRRPAPRSALRIFLDG